jgi:hypothetical protein
MYVTDLLFNGSQAHLNGGFFMKETNDIASWLLCRHLKKNIAYLLGQNMFHLLLTSSDDHNNC